MRQGQAGGNMLREPQTEAEMTRSANDYCSILAAAARPLGSDDAPRHPVVPDFLGLGGSAHP